MAKPQKPAVQWAAPKQRSSKAVRGPGKTAAPKRSESRLVATRPIAAKKPAAAKAKVPPKAAANPARVVAAKAAAFNTVAAASDAPTDQPVERPAAAVQCAVMMTRAVPKSGAKTLGNMTVSITLSAYEKKLDKNTGAASIKPSAESSVGRL